MVLLEVAVEISSDGFTTVLSFDVPPLATLGGIGVCTGELFGEVALSFPCME